MLFIKMKKMEDDIDDVFGGSKASGYIRLMLAKKKGMKVKDYAPEKKAREKKSKKYQVCKQDKFSGNVLERFANKKLKENTNYPTEPEEWLYQRGPNYYRRGPDRKPEHKGNVIMPNEYHPDECKKDSTLEKKEQREAEKKAKKQEKEASKPTPEQKKAMKKEYDAQRYQKIKEVEKVKKEKVEKEKTAKEKVAKTLGKKFKEKKEKVAKEKKAKEKVAQVLGKKFKEKKSKKEEKRDPLDIKPISKKDFANNLLKRTRFVKNLKLYIEKNDNQAGNNAMEEVLKEIDGNIIDFEDYTIALQKLNKKPKKKSRNYVPYENQDDLPDDFLEQVYKLIPTTMKGKGMDRKGLCCKECKDDKVCMSKKAYLSEHDRLIKMLADKDRKGLKGGVLSEEKKKQLAEERKAYMKDMKENPEKYKTKSFDPSEGGTKEPCSYRRALEKGGVSFGHLTSAGYQTPEDCQRIQQANIDEGQRRMLDNESGINKFFRKVVGGLTKVADFATNLPFVPTVAKEAYKAFAPPGSEFYSGGRIVKLKVMKGAGMKPEEKTFFITAEQTYEDNPPKQVGDFLLIGNSPTIDAWLNYKTNTIMIAVRGTKDFRDVKADISLPFNNLINTQRYKTDKMIVGGLAKTFSPSVYDYYLTGHSLGGAIVAQLKRDFPFLKDAVLYNSAFQPKDLIQQSSATIKRNYTSDDPLYQAGGKLFIGANVLPMSSSDVDGVLGKVIKGYKGHKISKFRELYAM
jgi:hypothetical protein